MFFSSYFNVECVKRSAFLANKRIYYGTIDRPTLTLDECDVAFHTTKRNWAGVESAANRIETVSIDSTVQAQA